MKCQAIMKPNMNTPHRNATTIQTSSTFSMGSFHQIRRSGGDTDIAIPCCLTAASPRSRANASLLAKRNGSHLHDAPNEVKNGRQCHTEEQQQEWIVENALHQWCGLVRV